MPDKEIYNGIPIGMYESMETFYPIILQLIPGIKVDYVRKGNNYTKTWLWSWSRRVGLTYQVINNENPPEVFVRLFARTDKKIAGIEAKIREHEGKALEAAN